MSNLSEQDRIYEFIRSDAFCRQLGADIEEIRPGYARVSMTVTETMMNFHGMTHGGVVFSLADIAFGAASNSYGRTALAMNVNTHILKPTKTGDRLVAEATELNAGGRTALYDLVVKQADSGDFIARCRGQVYRTGKEF